MNTTTSFIAMLILLGASVVAYANDGHKTASTASSNVAQPLPANAIVIAPPTVTSPIFTNIPDLAPRAK